MQIETSRFGRVELPEDSLIHFPHGLYGLESSRDFFLLPHDEAGCFYWLQSVEEPHLAMVVTNPFDHFPEYEVTIGDAAEEVLETDAATDVTILTTIAVPRGSRQVYVNLLGPLVLNSKRRIGLQLVQDGSRYTTRHLLGSALAADEAA